jgi:hypothetical protein
MTVLKKLIHLASASTMQVEFLNYQKVNVTKGQLDKKSTRQKVNSTKSQLNKKSTQQKDNSTKSQLGKKST